MYNQEMDHLKKKQMRDLRWYFLLASVLLAVPVLSGFYTGATGKVLVATNLADDDPYFSKSAVYIFEHSIWGAKGVILNRPVSDDMKSDFFFPDETPPYPVFKGGPVMYPDMRLVAVEHENAVGLLKKQPLLFLHYDMSDAFLSDHDKRSGVKVFIGISGWGAGQLEREIDAGVWEVQRFEGRLFSDE